MVEGFVSCSADSPAPSPDIYYNVYYTDHVTSLSDIKENLTGVYERISQRLVKLIVDSSIFDEEKPKEKKQLEEIKASLATLPQKAINAYEAQYIKLAEQFDDFAYFAQLQNFDGIQKAVRKNGNALQKLSDTANKIDVGLSNLNSVVNSITTNYNEIQAQDIVDDLRRKYNAVIEDPIIDDKEIKADSENITLKFPKIVDAFIPQSYKCLSYQRREERLEDESLWNKLPVQRDMDRFFVKYLYSPDSIDYPLVILGHPGSGKSLLTKVLAAQLMSDSYTVIRIPLREVDADADIDVLVEDQVKKLTNRPLSTQGYGGFASQFNEKPLIIILDGFDELLQAKGDVFIGYLEKARLFQQNQKSMNRPVRMIITSRITLIDKARIPENSTVLRLMEFDTKQRQAWIDIWNNTNNNYFSEKNIDPFKLPPMEGKKKGSLLELAEQPLLLLMLAIYDSEANELAYTGNIKRTELYDNLLRRFVRRERGRYVPDFSNKNAIEQDEIIDKEMKRLGVVAIGMYNRQDVVILSDQLENDLDYFRARRTDGSPESRTLKEADSVLGGFFFIHKSTAQDMDAHSDSSVSAFEFLHNTFGEFLAADFILRYTVTETKEMFLNRKFNMISAISNKISDPDAFDSGWFACLMFVPLYSRPVIIEMLQEHASKALQRCDVEITQDEFIDSLKFIVMNQLKMVLNTRNSPSVMRNGILSDRDIPLVGYLSTYTLNLVVLSSILCPNGFEFNEDEYRNSEINELDSKPWDKIALLWRTWFSAEDLAGLSVVLKAHRESESKVIIKCNDKFEATRYEQPIDILLCVSSTLADNLFTGLTGLHTQRFAEITKMKIQEIKEMLKSESPDLYFSFLIGELRREINGFSDKRKKMNEYGVNLNKINNLIMAIFDEERLAAVNSDTLLCLYDILECCFHRNMIYLTTRKELVWHLSRLLSNSKINLKKWPNPEIVCVRLLKLLDGSQEFPILDGKMLRHELSIRSEFSIRNNLLMSSFSEYFERIITNYSEYERSDKFSLFDLEFGNTYQVSLLDAVENSMMMDSGEKIDRLSQFVKPENLHILLETNPELLSRVILLLVQDNGTENVVTSNMREQFFSGCYRQLSSVGIWCFGFDATINAIKIARIIENNEFLTEITDILQHQLFGKHPEFFSTVAYKYPTFVANLIEVMPNLFSDGYLDIIESFFRIEKRIRYIGTEKMIDVIKIFNFLCREKKFEKHHGKIRESLRHLLNVTCASIRFSGVRLEKLTLMQLRDLSWYAEIANDRELHKRIQDVISRFPDSIHDGVNCCKLCEYNHE